MCGIMGYVGRDAAWEIVMSGLRRLEYRGYDSAGIATVAGERLHLARRVGHLSALQANHPQGLPGNIGVGHTRWATHGGVTEANCHPHRDAAGRIAIVHNGIIDNVEALRAKLVAAGVRFRSQTDTEVLAEIIGRAVDEGLSLRDAVVSAMKSIEGTAGLIAMDRLAPERLVVARVGSPVVVGIGEGASWVASDAVALRPYTDRMIVLDEGEVAELTATSIATVDLEQRDRDKRVEKILHQLDDAEMGDFPHFMLKEIHEQPAALERSMAGRLDAVAGSARLGGLQNHEARLFDIRHVVFCACGTSLYSAQVGAYLMSRYARMPASAEDAAELSARNPIVDRHTLYVAISQSGETADTLSAVREIRLRGGLIAGITNVVGSSLSRETDFGIYVHAGPEISVASTKAFTAQVLAAELLALRFARMRDLAGSDGRLWVTGLQGVPEQMGTMLQRSQACKGLAERFRDAHFTLFVGRGINVPVAAEGALKLKEIAYLPAEGLSAAAMKHGPLALIEPGSPVWALVPPDDTRDRMLGNLRELSARGAYIMAVAGEGDVETRSLADHVIALPPHHPALSPMLNAVPLQLYAYYVALAKGCNIDKPRNLAKSLTVM
ncbi:MAG TPA: glutamine--fructose-6-phosphate transaminase (isomerizing) [Polyangiaceae bacterium]|nr:glutamine--fructose-6-phosphate transaminase (isomerizing) [Polyangiaceae bacterium]